MRVDVAVAAALLFMAAPALAQKGVLPTSIVVGGAPMVSDRDLMENLARSAEHRTLVALLHTAGLADTLRQHGPFTLFAPTDAAFAALPSAELEQMRRPEGHAALVKLLQTHIVPGDYSSARLRFLMRGNKGQAELEDLAGAKLVVTNNGPSNLILRDAPGDAADIVLYDVRHANGVMFVIDRVLAPG